MVQIDIEMPKSCDVCPFVASDWSCNCYVADCYGEDVGDYEKVRHPCCPLREVQDVLDTTI